jgi:hypothetical protein
MNTKIRSFAFCLTACLLACVTGHAYEQDNWYLHGPIDGNLTGVFHQEYNATAKKDMLYKTVAGLGLEVRDINGTLLQTINTGGITFTDIEYDQNTSRLFGINASKLTCYEQNSSGGWSEQWRSTQSVTTMAQAPNGKLYCANNGNKFYVFEQNGTMSKEFGWVDGIESLSNTAKVLGFAPSGTLVASGQFTQTGGSNNRYSLFYFNSNGDYLRHINHQYHDGYLNVSKISPSGMVYVRSDSSSYWGGHLIYHPDGSTVPDPDVQVYLWLQNGDFIWSNNLYRRTFRTKMETNHNSVPQPVIHRIAQRAGTNILELDFEVIDTDDDNVTVGILAYCGSDKLVPQTWLNGTGSKIGTPIATNTVHSMEWDVKQDWPNSTGSIKFEILCQDGSRDKPVDLHFLKLPFADGNMTISRSPLKDSDFVNYAKFLLATGQAQFESNTSNAVILPAEANTTEVFTFTNCGATGRNGPTEAQIQAEYNGTNLQGAVTTGWKAGYQKWTVPATGDYWIEAVGAKGGDDTRTNNRRYGSFGTFVRGKFFLNQNAFLNIVIGQAGEDNNDNNSNGAAGGGGSFVIADTNNTPLIISGGGGGCGRSYSSKYTKFSTGSSGIDGFGLALGGVNGSGGTGEAGGGGGGFLTNGTGDSADRGGQSFQNGSLGGNGTLKGGFGGGGGTKYGFWEHGGGGGGYSGGGGAMNTGTRDAGGAGGNYNSGSQRETRAHFGGTHGLVRIYRAEGNNSSLPEFKLLDVNWNCVSYAKLCFALGEKYKIASPEEVTKAREAATPGGVNNWTATNQVKPRNLPGKVNEYGFDVSTTEGLWVIKE